MEENAQNKTPDELESLNNENLDSENLNLDELEDASGGCVGYCGTFGNQ